VVKSTIQNHIQSSLSEAASEACRGVQRSTGNGDTKNLRSLESGGKLLIFGNGGSAADDGRLDFCIGRK
jgi:phosphoheptose isomerase